MLNIGVIGCGAIGRDHIRRLHDLVRVQKLLLARIISRRLLTRLQHSMAFVHTHLAKS